MTAESGPALIEAFFERMVSESREAAAREFLAADAVVTINGTEYDLESYLERLRVSDERFEVLDVETMSIIEQDTRLAARHELQMEHRGTAYGVEPEHNRYVETSSSFFEIEDGAVVALDIIYDPTATLEELGLLSEDPTTEKLRDQYYEVLTRVLRHNLRNNLNIILAKAETVTENPEQAATDIERTATTLLSTVEKARKIEQTAIDSPLELSTFHVQTAVDEVLDRYQSRDGMTTHCICEQSDIWLTSDRRLFQNLLEEAVENGALYNDSETPEITIEVKSVQKGSGDVELRISDNGPGIPEGELEPLRQDQETKLLHGSGIGLWVIKWCVTRLDGTIAFGEDSEIRITVPDLNP